MIPRCLHHHSWLPSAETRLCLSLCFTRCCFCSAYVTDSQTHWAAVPLICCHSLHVFLFFFLSKCTVCYHFVLSFGLSWGSLFRLSVLHVGWMWISDDFAVFSFTKSKITFKTINLFGMLHTYLSAVYCHQQIYVLRSVGHHDSVSVQMNGVVSSAAHTQLVRCSWCFQHLPSHYMRTWTHKLHERLNHEHCTTSVEKNYCPHIHKQKLSDNPS